MFVLNGFPFCAAMNCPRPLLVGSSVLLGALLLLGCGGGDSASDGGWTVQEGTLTLERDLLVGDDESFYFGSVGDVAVGSDGQMYVLDWSAQHVKVIGPNGVLQDTLGRKGKGPGEFQRPREIVVARGDSLYVLDGRLDRISVFTPTGAFAYSVQSGSGGNLPEGLMVPKKRPGFVLAYSSISPPDSEEEGAFTVRRIYSSERPADTILVGEPRDMVYQDQGDFMVFRFIPFGRTPRVAMGPEDHVYFGQSDSLRLTGYALDGTRLGTDVLPFEAAPVTEEEREQALDDIQSGLRSALRDRLPSTKPAFNDFFVDDEGRYWLERPTAQSDSTDWWMAWPEEQRVATTRLSRGVDIEAVRGDYAYGETSTEKGAPALVRYRVRVNSEQ